MNTVKKIDCQICHRKFLRINRDHLCGHGLNLETYKQMFPNSETNSKIWVGKQQLSHKDQIAWNKGLTKETNDVVAKYAKSNSQHVKTAEHSQHISESKKGKPFALAGWNEYLRAYVHSNKKQNKPELRMGKILDKYFPEEWKYVGLGDFIIAGKCPDFVNVNGKKQIIEVFGEYWHRNHKPEDRANVFKPFGYSTLVIWEKELVANKDAELAIVDKVKNFSSIETLHAATSDKGGR